MPNQAYKFDFAPPGADQITKQLTLRATHYNAHRAMPQQNGIPLLARDGTVIGPKMSPADWCKGSMEGTLIVNDGQSRTVYNHGGQSAEMQVDCRLHGYPNHPNLGKNRWKVTEAPLGEGVFKMHLVAFRTIAIDNAQPFIPYRSVVYIQSARGLPITLPDGTVVTHDGYFYSADTGEMVGGHIDVFVGDRDHNPFPFIKGRNGATFPAQLINNPAISQHMAEIHRSVV